MILFEPQKLWKYVEETGVSSTYLLLNRYQKQEEIHS